MRLLRRNPIIRRHDRYSPADANEAKNERHSRAGFAFAGRRVDADGHGR
jgi:hypothetical protein